MQQVADLGQGVAAAAERHGGPFVDPYYKVPAGEMDALKAACAEWSTAGQAWLSAVAEVVRPPDRVVVLEPGTSATISSEEGSVVVRLPHKTVEAALVRRCSECNGSGDRGQREPFCGACDGTGEDPAFKAIEELISRGFVERQIEPDGVRYRLTPTGRGSSPSLQRACAVCGRTDTRLVGPAGECAPGTGCDEPEVA